MAITASLYNNICYPSAAAAADAYFSGMPVAVSVDQFFVYKIEYISNGAGGWTYTKTSFDNGGIPTTLFSVAVVPPVFASCDSSQSFNDGMQIGWGVVGAMVAAFSVIFIKKALFPR